MNIEIHSITPEMRPQKCEALQCHRRARWVIVSRESGAQSLMCDRCMAKAREVAK